MSVTVIENGGIIEVKSLGIVVIDGGQTIEVNNNVNTTEVIQKTNAIETKQASILEVFPKLNVIEIIRSIIESGGGGDNLYFDNKGQFPLIGEIDKIYVSKDNGLHWTWNALIQKYIDSNGRIALYKAVLTENINNEIVSDILLSTFANVNIYTNIIDFNFEKQYIFETNDINSNTIISINDTEFDLNPERYDLKVFDINLLGITKFFQFGYFIQGFSFPSMGKNLNKVSICIEVYP